MDCGTLRTFLALFITSLGAYYDNLCRGVSQLDERSYTTWSVRPISYTSVILLFIVSVKPTLTVCYLLGGVPQWRFLVCPDKKKYYFNLFLVMVFYLVFLHV